MIEFKHKLQGDGRDSWECRVYSEDNTLIDAYMVYTHPDELKKKQIEEEAEKLFNKLLEDNWYSRFDISIYATKGEEKAVKLLEYYDNLWNIIETNFNSNNLDFSLPEYNG